jgi:hypothetical protein
MPTITLRVSRFLCQTMNVEPLDSNEISVTLPAGESIREITRRLAAERGGAWKRIFDEETQEVAAHILVIVNGRIVNPHDRAAALLREDDELMLLPMFDGGWAGFSRERAAAQVPRSWVARG